MPPPTGNPGSAPATPLLAVIAHSIVQSSTRTFFHKDILNVGTVQSHSPFLLPSQYPITFTLSSPHTLSNNIHSFFSSHIVQSHVPSLLLSHCPITCALSSPVTLSNHIHPFFSSHIVQSRSPFLLISHCPITFILSSPLTLSNHILSSHLTRWR